MIGKFFRLNLSKAKTVLLPYSKFCIFEPHSGTPSKLPHHASTFLFVCASCVISSGWKWQRIYSVNLVPRVFHPRLSSLAPFGVGRWKTLGTRLICGGNLRLRIVLLPTNLWPVHAPKRCKIDMFQISCFVRQLDNYGQKCDEVVDAECIVSHMIYSSSWSGSK